MEQSPNNTYQAIGLLKQYFFPIRKQYFTNTQNSDFSIVLKICNSSFTYITVICKLIIWLGSNFDMCYLKVSTLWKSYGFFISCAVYMSGPEHIERRIINLR